MKQKDYLKHKNLDCYGGSKTQIKRAMIRYIRKKYKFFKNIQGKTVRVHEVGNLPVKRTDPESKENHILMNIIIY